MEGREEAGERKGKRKGTRKGERALGNKKRKDEVKECEEEKKGTCKGG